jgi:hypothetical protein
MNGDDPVLILVSPFGLVEMSLNRSSDGYQYSVDEGPAKFQGTLVR